MNVYATTGYGFKMSEMSDDGVVNFFMNERHLKTMNTNQDMRPFAEKVKAMIANNPDMNSRDLDEILEEYESNGYMGMPGMIANIISMENEIVVSHIADEADHFIMIVACTPWDMPEKNKKLDSKEAVDKVMAPYAEELNSKLEGQTSYFYD